MAIISTLYLHYNLFHIPTPYSIAKGPNKSQKVTHAHRSLSFERQEIAFHFSTKNKLIVAAHHRGLDMESVGRQNPMYGSSVWFVLALGFSGGLRWWTH